MTESSASRSRVLVATRNAGKLRELRALFANLGVDLVDLAAAGLPESPEEDELESYDTFESNALAKARHFHALSGLPTVADDSGLSVDALGGSPGVHSKRYAGVVGASAAVDAANNAKLQRALAGAADRRARFVCAAAFVDGGRETVARGEAPGRILDEARGREGFGYDPYFLSDDLGVTFAEASVAQKEGVSHRGRAFRALVSALREAGWSAVDGPARTG
ncbi:Nucleoside-triphosphatase rdgB [Gemmatirosa kalamazoonensis]|uniref:dITP/XTP pyrophosphatase n=1 Tax=Gemmatirosa kalamazoonensis TaxID=861299 RepID=W0RJ01_9BACT|nr:RdgB/HAM1 family non-canonical purine NTP pyrophosphatase [Gemmatirosa kalamazoonensis]AHG90741.1 Nucleoside-triphosphatase rdgB [Gemmatirosa kalamazoonensis]